MRFCVFGAGAIGAYVGARLRASEHDVVFYARGAHLAALRDDGLTVHEADGATFTIPVDARGRDDAVDPVDVVLLAIKAHQTVAALPDIVRLCDERTVVITLQNGIPWWYTYGHPIAAGWDLATVDPGGTIAATLGLHRAIGAIVYFSSNIAAPGVIVHGNGVGLPLGEPRTGTSARIEAISAALCGAGMDSPVRHDLRGEIWGKLLGNAAFNPLSALTRAFVREMFEDAETMSLVREVMLETAAVAHALGDDPPITIEERLEMSPHAGDIRTSMLQDAQAGRRMEIAPIVGAVVELGGRTRVPTPATRHLLTMVGLLDRALARENL